MSRTNTVIVLLLVCLSLVLAVSSFWNDSFIVDEIPHVGAGYGYVKKLDYRLNPEHPPLAKVLAALPLLFTKINQAVFDTPMWITGINDQWEFGRFLIFNSGNDAAAITRLAKFPMLIFFVLSAWLLGKWTKECYGKTASLMAIVLFSFSPTVLAHSRFVTTDLAALFGVLFATYYFLRYLFEPTRKNMWLAGIMFGLALLTKFSLFLLIPYFLFLTLAWALVHKKKSLLAIGYWLLVIIIGVILVVWPVYAALTWNYPPHKQRADTEFILGSFGNRTLAKIDAYFADKLLIRGLAQYGLGLLMVGQRVAGGNTVYFLGEVSAQGWKHYFPVVYAIKEPLPWLILIVVVLLYLATKVKSSIINLQFSFNDQFPIPKRLKIWVWKFIETCKLIIGKWLRRNFVEFAILLWLVIYWYTSITGNLNIGIRHLLPTYPFAIMLISGQIAQIVKNLKIKMKNKSLKFKKIFYIFNFTLFILLGWYIIENLRVWPHYLSYFNQLAGGPSGGYRYVTDSNLDWGQDLKRLAKWTEKNNIPRIYLDYFGWSDPHYYLTNKHIPTSAGRFNSREEFLQKNPQGGYLAVSATFYMTSRENTQNSYAWLDGYKPITVIGNSIWVWKFLP